MRSVFILWHVHELADGDEDEKLIGVYASEEDARAAIHRVRDQQGFRDNPEGFQISKYEVGKDHWTEGFVVALPDQDGSTERGAPPDTAKRRL